MLQILCDLCGSLQSVMIAVFRAGGLVKSKGSASTLLLPIRQALPARRC